MACIFCGGGPLTNEHIFPQWLSRYLGPDRRQQLEQARYGPDGFDFQRPSYGLDFRVRVVCATCNNGWMSDLEAASIPILDPLIAADFDGQWIDAVRFISLRDQRAIALWAVKTAMMLDHTQAVPILPPAQLKRLRSHRAIPSNARVWMGACDELQPLVISHTVRIELERLDGADLAPRPVGFYAPMKLGRLILLVYFPGEKVVVHHPPRFHFALVRIRPRRGSDVPWPPPSRAASGQSFEVMAQQFWPALQLLTPEAAREQGIRES